MLELFIIGIFIGFFIFFIALYPKTIKVQKIDKEVIEQNKKYNIENQDLIAQNQSLKIELTELNAQKNELKNSIFSLSQQAEESATILYEKNIELMQEKLSQAAKELSDEFQCNKDKYEEEYLSTLYDYVCNFNQVIAEREQFLANLNENISKSEKTMAVIIESNKRLQEIKEKENFYKLNLSEQDLEEISHLKDIEKYLRNPEPLNKVIWKVYYEKPYTDLIGRVIGNKTKTGIYKITNTENQMCYIGQAVDIADRWRQHIKRGLGAEAPTKNKLYPAMQALGVENFTFEIIEECPKAELNEKEDYWQDYFKAKEFGYSIK